jgi:Fe-S oxidoreductase
VLRDVAKWLGGIASQRQMPPFAPQTFRDWYRRRPTRNHDKPVVLLWVDTFNNYFHPEIGKATVEVLEAAGYQVWIPEANLCCGRPLYDFGMLDTARGLLREALTTLQPLIEAGVPVVGMEPSCTAVFRDELCEIMPENQDAQRLKNQTFLLSEFLNKKVPNYRPPRLERKALVQVHCHHKSVMGMDDEKELLHKMGLDYEMPNPTCCGMAGSFGFERGNHYDVSIAVGERHLLPAVRAADRDTLILADGFSCQEQVVQTTARRPLHLAQVLQMALRGETGSPDGEYPEERYPAVRLEGTGERLLKVALLGAGAALAGGLLWKGLSKGRNGREGATVARGPRAEDVRAHLRDRRRGDEYADGLRERAPAER